MTTRKRAVGLAALAGFLAITLWSAGLVPAPCCSATCESCPVTFCKGTAAEWPLKVSIAHSPESSSLDPVPLVVLAASASNAGTSVLPYNQDIRHPMRN